MYVKNISDGYFHLKNTFWVMKLHMVFIHLVFVTVLKGFKVPLTVHHLSSLIYQLRSEAILKNKPLLGLFTKRVVLSISFHSTRLW